MRRSARFVSVVAPVALLLGGCGGGGDDADPGPTSTMTATAAPAPEALSGFTCAATADGSWSAGGTIANAGDEPASYTVNLYVGPADGQERPAQEVRVEEVQPGGSTPVEFTGVAAAGDPATCHVRVMRDLP